MVHLFISSRKKATDSLRRLFLQRVSCGSQRPDGGQGGDGVLVDHLLLAIGNQYHHKAVIACDSAPELEAVH